MKLTGIDCQVPSRQILNDDIVAIVKEHSGASKNLNEIEILIKKILASTGIKSRYWREKGENPLDLLAVAVENALKMSGLKKNEIDLVIYSSIDRGFLEPANSTFVCKALGLLNTRNFDIVDACMGWATAVQVAQSFLTGPSPVNAVLVVNVEFPMDLNGAIFPENFTINKTDELKWKAASFTLGEGASACIFERDASADCKFEFIESPEYTEACVLPIPNFEKFFKSLDDYPHAQAWNFFSNSASLISNGRFHGIEVLQTLLQKLSYKPKIIFPHSVSNKLFEHETVNEEIKSIIYSTYSNLGNLATASVPSAIKKAMDGGFIGKNEKGIVWIASAGMKFSAFEIQL